jgi:VCBS repeat protein
VRGQRTSCTVQPLPAGISLVGSLNYVSGGGAAVYGPGFGITVRARQMMLNGQNVVVVGVGTPAGTGKLEIFFIDPISGQVLDNTIIGSATSPQPHISVNYGDGTRSLAVGDVNADGIPDFAAGSSGTGSANVEVGSLSPAGLLSYQVYPLNFPANATGIGWGIGMGDLSGDGSDEIAAGAIGGGGSLGQVCIFSFNGTGFTNTQNIVSPLPNPKKDESFGLGVAIADVTGTGAKDLIVGAPGTTINKATSAGRVFVFPGPVNAASYLTYSTGGKSDSYGRKVGGGDVDGDSVSDLLAATAWNTTSKAQVYHGLVSSGQAANYVLQPLSGLNAGWSTTEPDIADVNGDGLADILIGAPNAESSPVCGGVAYLYLSNGLGAPLANRLTLSSPVLEPQGSSSFQAFGWATGFAGSGTRLFFVSDNGLDLGGAPAGQVYIFKVN